MSIFSYFLDEIIGINLLDIGSSGRLDLKWAPIENYIHLVGFDPNDDECKRMNSKPHPYRSAVYLPYALAGENGKATLYKTRNIYCYSLLEPNTEWLRRFSFKDLFELIGTEELNTRTIDQIDEIQDRDIDVIKIDTQGMELPILSRGRKILDQAFYVETETGFLENYRGETTYAQIDEFMRSRGFLLFDLNISHRISRNNLFRDQITGKEQILWCEAVWLKDYISLARKQSSIELTREKALKVMILCSLQGCIDFGFEQAGFFSQLGLLSQDELKHLELYSNWVLQERRFNFWQTVFNVGLRLFPRRIRKKIVSAATKAVLQPHILKEWFRLTKR